MSSRGCGRGGRRKTAGILGLEGRSTAVVADEHIHVSLDGRRRLTNLKNLEGLDNWVPIGETDAASADWVDEEVVYVQIQAEEGSKRKTYASDDPMKVWRPAMAAFLDEILRAEGLGHRFQSPKCSDCNSDTLRPFRCIQCGQYLLCEQCVRVRHQRMPLHSVKAWNGDFWDRCELFAADRGVRSKAGSSQNNDDGPDGVFLGMIYQLGHHGGPCPLPEPTVRSLTVIHTTGVCTINVRFCGCSESLRHRRLHVSQLIENVWYPATISDPQTCATFEVLDLFQRLQAVGNINAQSFVVALERLTDPTLTRGVRDRYRPFSRMARQWAFLTRLKRAGRAHKDDGVAKTPPGALAVWCWACPHPGRNMPTGWEDTPEALAYLHALILAIDANFRMKNRIRPNKQQNTTLGPGLGFFVNPAPYKTHINRYTSERDFSTCIAFQALTAKDTKLTTGLRVSGVGGLVCARHGLMRPTGMGDLQKGERYSNMDYIALSALSHEQVKHVVLSYDIACQWKQRLPQRAADLLASGATTTDISKFKLQYALPVWHAEAHEEKCRSANSLTHAVGVGRTDGEAIERLWALLNPISYATKEMGEGNRHDTIEAKLDYLNFEKNITQGDTLKRKLVIALAQRDKHVYEFEELDNNNNKFPFL
uniref:CxC2-like cysteine cluster KDZ transposase-associated domain-containing protein n=1 Tax=Mycena chlorophos TaxID=658473 RepID=A0ABQ0L5B8_MYCCL|nr:predicted protein [Mycena chlorophos]